MVDRYGREQAIKASGRPRAWSSGSRRSGRTSRTASSRSSSTRPPEALGKKAGSLLNSAEKAAAAERLVQRDGERIGQMLDELAASGQKPNVTGLVGGDASARGRRDGRGGLPEAQRAARQMDGWLTSVETKIGEGDAKALLEGERRATGRHRQGRRRGGAWPSGRAVCKAMVDELEATGSRAAADGLGPDFAARWKNAASDYQASTWLSEATRESPPNRLQHLSAERCPWATSASLETSPPAARGLPMAIGGR